jgi:hypothetical protein
VTVARLVLLAWAALSLVSGLVEAQGFESSGGDETAGGVLIGAAVLIVGLLVASLRSREPRYPLSIAAVVAGASLAAYLLLNAG